MGKRGRTTYVKSTNRLNFEDKWLETFKTKFEKVYRGHKDDNGIPSECWEWTGAFQKPVNNQHPYGVSRINYDDGTASQAQTHRISWYVYRGVIPDKLLVLHNCNNPKCGNPSHLRLGTHRDNHDDSKKAGTWRFFRDTTPTKLITRTTKEAVLSRYIELGYRDDMTNRKKADIRNKISEEFPELTRSQILQSWNPKKVKDPNAKTCYRIRCELDGVEYESIAECRRATGISDYLAKKNPTFIELD